MFHIQSSSYPRNLINISTIIQQIRILMYHFLIRFEINDIDLIKPDQSYPQSNITQSQLISSQIPRFAQSFLRLIQLFKQILHSIIISILTLSKSASINTIINIIIYIRVNLTLNFLQIFRIQIQIRILSKLIKFTIKHLNNLRRFIIYNLFILSII